MAINPWSVFSKKKTTKAKKGAKPKEAGGKKSDAWRAYVSDRRRR